MRFFAPLSALVLIAIPASCHCSVSSAVAAEIVAARAQTGATVQVVDGRLRVDGVPYFFFGNNPGPRRDFKTPEGRSGWAELYEGGIRVVRGDSSGHDENWTRESIDDFGKYLDAAWAHGVRVSPMLRELVSLRRPKDKELLTYFVNKYKDHPGVLMWKSADEPEWGKIPAAPLTEAYKLIRELDPNHPVWIAHAPRGTLETLRPYNAACDIVGADIYPVSEPPGKHSLLPNRDLSMVGDYTRRVAELGGGERATMMVLQGASWSGVSPKHNKNNRYMQPTLRQERYMVYQAIICGADNLAFFGNMGNLIGREEELGFNWTWWRAVLKPLLAEIKEGSELYPVLTAPDTKYPLQFTGAPQVEARWKEAGIYLYILAAAREGQPVDVRFSGLQDGEVTVLFENRTIDTRGGSFTDRFAPHDVHVYRALRVLPKGRGGGPPEGVRPKAEDTYYHPPTQPN